MINTIIKTIEAQEKTQDIKQSPSIKIGTKPYARSQRNELAEATEHWTGRWKRDRMRGPNAGGNRPDVGTQCPIEYRKVPERHIYDRTLAIVRLVFCRLNGWDDRTRPVRMIQRPISSSFVGIRPQRLLSQWGL